MTRLTEAERDSLIQALEWTAEMDRNAGIPVLEAKLRRLIARIEAAEYIELGPEELTP